LEINLSRLRVWAQGLMQAISGAPARTRITIETDQALIIRRRRSTRGWCGACGHDVEMVSLQEAAVIAGTNGPLLGDGAVRGWHFSAGEEKWVCLDSILIHCSTGKRARE
jgi:hypothetical protein